MQGSVQRRSAERGGSGAFTLIELLVVIAVVLILAALLMPALARSIRLGHRTQCASNLAQVQRGLMLYANQYSRYYVANRPRRSGCGDDDLSPLVLDGYCTDLGVFACPGSTDDPQTPEDLRHKPTEGGKGSYEYWGENNPGLRYQRVNTVIIVVAHDEDGRGGRNMFVDDGDNHGSAGINSLFLDGHVAWVIGREWWPGPLSVASRALAEWAKTKR